MELMQRLNFEYGNEDILNLFLDAVKKHPGSCDNVWLSTLYGHPTLAAHTEVADKLKRSAKKLRDAGISVSLQISNTMGHGALNAANNAYAGLNYENSAVTKMVGHDGAVADYCYCWRNSHFKKYICDMLTIYAERIRPDCIWVDDDFRPRNHKPVNFGCFCDNCIAEFNAKHGYSYNREDLVQDFLYGDIQVRQNFIDFIREGMANLMKEMCLAVKRVSPESVMCYQHGAYGSYSGYSLDFVYDAMYKTIGKPPMSRPGGGAYEAHDPNEIIDKSVYICWQNAMLPEYVKRTAPEIENIPFTVYGKSPLVTALETSCYFAYGSTDMSYSNLRRVPEDYSFYEDHLRVCSEQRGYWEKLSEYNKNSYQSGIRYFQTKYLWKRELSSSEGILDLNKEPYCGCYQLVRDGVPISYDKKEELIFLHPDIARAIDSSELEYLLSKNVITDAASIDILTKRGFDLGVKVRMLDEYEIPIVQRKFVGDDSGKLHGQGGCFPADTRAGLIYPTEKMVVLATASVAADRLAPFTDDEKYPYGVAECVVETSAGAKWAIFGFALWNGIVHSAVIKHILDTADYISNNSLAARILSPSLAVLLPRKNDEGKTACVSVINCTIGKSGELEVLIRNPKSENFRFMSQYNGECDLAFEKRGNDYVVKLPSLEPWSVGTVFI